MHAHDKTLLSSLGFADKDKRDKRHDSACRYLGLPEHAEKLVAACIAREGRTAWDSQTERYSGTVRWTAVKDPRAAYEVPIHKGEGQYRTTIGFIDLAVEVTLLCHSEGRRQRRHCGDGTWSEPEPKIENYDDRRTIRVEVKINEVSVGDILRQINLYNTYIPDYSKTSRWIVATLFRLDADEVRQLKEQKIGHVRLGAGFLDYHDRSTKSVTESPEI